MSKQGPHKAAYPAPVSDARAEREVIASALFNHRVQVYADAVREASNYDPEQHERVITEQRRMAEERFPAGDDEAAQAVLNALRNAGYRIGAADVERLGRVERYAREVMDALEQYGASIVGHLLDDDNNSGERLRRALRGDDGGLDDA
jgi:hypothetical protein